MNTELRIYCENCDEATVAKIEPISKDRLNENPYGDIVCSECHLVLATLSADIEGEVVFVAEPDHTLDFDNMGFGSLCRYIEGQGYVPRISSSDGGADESTVSLVLENEVAFITPPCDSNEIAHRVAAKWVSKHGKHVEKTFGQIAYEAHVSDGPSWHEISTWEKYQWVQSADAVRREYKRRVAERTMSGEYDK